MIAQQISLCYGLNPRGIMASYFSITIVVLAAFFGTSMAGIVPAAVAAPAPLIAAAPAPLAVSAPIAAAPVFGYAKAVPHNVPPHASRIDISTRNLAAPYVAAPYVAAPYAAAPAFAPAVAPAVAPAFAPAHLAYNPYAYAGNLAAPLVQGPGWV